MPPPRSQRLIEAAKRPLPEGTFAVGAGLMVAGITAYGFQILSFRALTKPDYAALNALWVFVFVLAPGFYLSLEQEVGRAVADRRARSIGGGPVVRRAALFGLILTICLTVVTIGVAASTSLVDRLFEGYVGLVACLVIALFTYCFQHVTRGTLAGNGRFGPYGLILAAEGVIRILPCIALAAAGVDNPIWYGLCLAVPPALGSLISLRGQHGLVEPGPEAPWSELSTNLGFLLGGSLLAQTLSYAPFLGVQILASSNQRDNVADFIVGLFLARIPILLFQAVQAALLPKLASLAGAGRHEDFRAGVRKLVFVVVGIGVIGVIAGGTLGPAVGEILFGSKFQLGNADLAMLAAGSGLFILAMTLAQALIALLGHSRVLVAWFVGLAAFCAVTAIGGRDLFSRVEIGFVAGTAAAALLMGVFLLRRLRAGIPDDGLTALVEQIEHEPLEI